MEDTQRSGLLSVVLPSYNEEASIPRAADTITAILIDADIPHELVFVDDGSRDRTWTVIQEQAGRHPQVRGVRFSRNFGKEAAMYAAPAREGGGDVPPVAGGLPDCGGGQGQSRQGKPLAYLCG